MDEIWNSEAVKEMCCRKYDDKVSNRDVIRVLKADGFRWKRVRKLTWKGNCDRNLVLRQ